ncbi:MAG: cob(I)yrinic acid a,c-diamide adenosyltransferase [Miltoncostaeaceae bacterium]
MVKLTRIYTRQGDAGDTHLGDMSRVRKTAARVVAYGDVDELNSVLGVARAQGLGTVLDRRLTVIQNDLFDLGADLCRPDAPGGPERLRMVASQVERLERWCDEGNEALPALTSFVLPAGTPAAAALHHARAVCRRAERSVVALADQDGAGAEALRYLNRLSDLLFIVARAANQDGPGDVLWVPGEGRAAD